MEILKKLRVSRRFALQGAVGGIGVSLWLPILDAMCEDNGEAFAQGDALPLSFGIFFWGNGFNPDQFNASGSGANWQLPPTMEPFGELKNDMTFVTGLDMMDGQFKGHGWGVMYVLAGGDGNICNVTSDITRSAENASATQYQPTIDQVIADAIHTNEPFKSIETGVLPYRGINMGTVSNNLAHRGPNNFLPPERDPVKLFNRIFEGRTGGTGGAGGSGGSPGLPSDISNKLRRSVLDAVLEDANRLKTTVGTADAQRIDAHMEGIHELEARIPMDGTGGSGNMAGSGNMGGSGGSSTGGGCVIPTAPTAPADMTARGQSLNRLIAAAVACNLTRVYTHLWSGARDENTYPTININSAHHDLTHAGSKPEHTQIEKYIMGQYADLAQVMKNTTIGAGTLLDRTLIYGISEVGEPQWHVHRDYRIILMGHAGGKVPGNRWVRADRRKVTELMLTMQQIMGLQVSQYGSWDRTTKTMPEILA